MDQNPYRVLGVLKTATATQIKGAYRKKCRLYHPDKNPSSKAKEMFLKVQKAYQILSDPDMKYAYDNFSAAKFDEWNRSRQNPQPSRWASFLSSFTQPQKPDESAQLNVHFEGKVYNLSTNLSDKIVNTKFTLAVKTGVRASEISLFFRGVELEDEQKDHKFYRIPKVAKLNAVRKSFSDFHSSDRSSSPMDLLDLIWNSFN